MASNLLKTFEKIERGRQKCITKANEVGYPLPNDASLEQVANCIDAQGYADEYYEDYKALITKDYSNIENGKIRIPYDIESIGAKAFYQDTNLKGVVFPGNLKTIGVSAFEGCKNWEGVIDLPYGVETIGTYAFKDTGYKSGSLQEGVNIPSSVTSIGGYAFRGTRGIVNFDANVTELSAYIFQNSSTATSGDATFITEFNISNERLNQITKIGAGAFSYQRLLTKLPIGSSVTSIDSEAFNYCEGVTEHVVIPASCKTIGNNAFAYVELQGGISFEEGLETIGQGAFKFAKTHTEDLIFPKTVKSIAQESISYAYNLYDDKNSKRINLKRVVIPYEETLSLGYGAFQYAYSDEMIIHAKKMTYTNQNGRQWYNSDFKTVVFMNLEVGTTLHSSAFSGSKVSEGGIYIPDDLVDYYKGQSGWSTFKNYIKPLTSWSGYADYIASLEVSE